MYQECKSNRLDGPNQPAEPTEAALGVGRVVKKSAEAVIWAAANAVIWAAAHKLIRNAQEPFEPEQ